MRMRRPSPTAGADPPGSGRFAETARAFRDVAVQPPLRRAETAFALACASDSAFTVTLGVVAFRDGGASAVGLVALLRMLPSALGSTLLTAYADRMRRERVLLVTSVARAVVVAAAAALTAADGPAAVIYALAVVATVAMTLFRPVHSALMPLLCRDTATLSSANITRGLLEAAAAIVGPVLAGVLLATASPAVAFAAIALLALGAAVPLARIHTEPGSPASIGAGAGPDGPGGVRAVARDAADGLHVVAGHQDLRLIFGLGFAQTLVRGALNVYIVVLALELLDTGDAGVATLSAGLGVGGVVGSLGASLLVGSRHLGRWLAVALVLWGSPIAVAAAAPGTAVAFAMFAAVGAANALIDVPLFTLPVRLADDAVLARAFGVFEALIALGVGLGSIAGPALIAATGLQPAMALTGLLLPALGFWRWSRLTHMDDRLGVRDDEIRALRRSPVLALLPVPIIEHLAAQVTRRTYPAGAVVFTQGEPGASVFVVISGQADVLGDGAVVAGVGPGDAFGEIAVLHDVPRTATIRARTDLQVFELARDDFLIALGRHPASGEVATATVARHLANFRPASLGA